MTTTVPTIKLLSGNSIPILGLGTWKSKPGQVAAAVKHAFEIGYRHIDCALIYGNEPEVGEAIKYALEDLKIPREEIFITSKLWNTMHNDEDVEKGIKESLKNLNLEYLDLYLIHWPIGFERGSLLVPANEDGSIRNDESIHPTDCWLSMEKLVKKGLTKDIGVSNFNSVQIQDILDKGTIKPATNQIEVHPYLNQSKLFNFCQKKGITVTAYSPLASPDRPWASADEPKLIDDPKLKGIADKHGKTPAQVVIKWGLQRGMILIPKSVTPSRIKENFSVFDFTLDQEDMDHLYSFECNGRMIMPLLNGKPRDAKHKHYPFNIEF